MKKNLIAEIDAKLKQIFLCLKLTKTRVLAPIFTITACEIVIHRMSSYIFKKIKKIKNQKEIPGFLADLGFFQIYLLSLLLSGLLEMSSRL